MILAGIFVLLEKNPNGLKLTKTEMINFQNEGKKQAFLFSKKMSEKRKHF